MVCMVSGRPANASASSSWVGAGSLFAICFGEQPARDFRQWLGGEREKTWRAELYTTLLQRGYVVAPHLTGCLSTAITQPNIDALLAETRQALAKLSG